MGDARRFDILIVGAGPAGMAAAWAASTAGRDVCLVDDNAAPGGQIWRGETRGEWFDKLSSTRCAVLTGTTVVGVEAGALIAEREGRLLELRASRVILATGARERFLPFSGWTLPGVTGAGGLQALVKGGLPVKDKRVVVAGSGPLLVAVAALLRRYGARVLLIAEQTTRAKLARFGASLIGHPAKLAQSASLLWRLRGVPLETDAWPVRAHGSQRLEAVELSIRGLVRRVECDYLACGFGLVPNHELLEMFHGGDTVLTAGEVNGIGGLDAAVVEGLIAGYRAAGLEQQAAALESKRRRARAFARLIDECFALRGELKSLAEPSTVVCRCEDVRLERLSGFAGWRDAKLHTRCGMGPCQGRVCGPALEFLKGWPARGARPPLLPVTVAALIEAGSGE